MVTDLGSPYGRNSEAWGINESGQVVGEFQDTTGEKRAFLWDNVAGMRELGTLGGIWSVAVDVNELGQVVGFSQTSRGATHAFVFDEGRLFDLGTLGGALSQAWDINNKTEVVGLSLDEQGRQHAFVWRAGAGMQGVASLRAPWSVAASINDQGLVVGTFELRSGQKSPFQITPEGVVRELPANDTRDIFAVRVSEVGDIGLLAVPPDAGMRGAQSLLFADGRATTLGGLARPPTMIGDVNDLGEVVGTATNALSDQQAFLWSLSLGIVPLPSLGKRFSRAHSVNNRGEVVGAAELETGRVHAVLWNVSVERRKLRPSPFEELKQALLAVTGPVGPLEPGRDSGLEKLRLRLWAPEQAVCEEDYGRAARIVQSARMLLLALADAGYMATTTANELALAFDATAATLEQAGSEVER